MIQSHIYRNCEYEWIWVVQTSVVQRQLFVCETDMFSVRFHWLFIGSLDRKHHNLCLKKYYPPKKPLIFVDTSSLTLELCFFVFFSFYAPFLPSCDQRYFDIKFMKIMGHAFQDDHVSYVYFADEHFKNVCLSKALPVFGFDLSSSYANYRSRTGISFSHY